MPLTLRLAYRNLFRNTRRTLLTCLLVGCSLASLMLTDALIVGMLDLMINVATGTFSGEAQIHRKGFLDSFDVDLYLADVEQARSILDRNEQITGYSIRTAAGGMISSTNNMSGGLIYGVDPLQEASVSKLRQAVFAGSYLTGAGNEILVGREMADLLEVELGDRIVITVAQAGGGELSQALFRLSGIFEFGMREIDNNMVFIALEKSRELLGVGAGAHEIAITFSDPDLASDSALPLYTALGEAGFEVQHWGEFMPQISAMIGMVDYSTFIIGLILFLLASLGVINSMFMSIYERIYEFGVIRAVGTEPGQLFRLVLTEALLLGLISIAFGLALGGGLGWYWSIHGVPIGEYEFSGISFAEPIKTVLARGQFTNYPVYVLLLTLVAAIYPARFAARIVPSQALQRTL